MWIINVVVALTLLSILIMVAYVFSMRRKHRKRGIELTKRFDMCNPSKEEKAGFEYYLSRKANYINNYICFQIVGKLCEMLSIIYSVSSFALNYVKDDGNVISVWKTIIPLMSVVLIIVVIYVVPSRRWSEYMEAWRKMDFSLNKVVEGKMPLSAIPYVLHEIECSITSDKV